MNSPASPKCGWRPVKASGDHVMTGCRGVLAATLLRALSDVRENNGFALEATVWIDSDRDDGPFTFLKICEALDLDAREVRKAAGNGSGRRR